MSIALRCLQGGTAPEIVVEGWKAWRDFPGDAQAEVTALAYRGLFTGGDPRLQAESASTAERYELDPDEVTLAVNGAGWLIERYAAVDLEPDAFLADVVALTGGESDMAREMARQYADSREDLRRYVRRQTFGDHGKLLVGLDWRVDTVSASSRSTQTDTKVIFLTLRYVEHDQPGRVTLQLPPDGVDDLKRFLEGLG